MLRSGQPVVTVRIVGGLGNQMFQYACGRAAAYRNGGRLLLDLSAFKRYELHRFGLHSFHIAASVAPYRLQTDSVLYAGLRCLGISSRWRMAVQGVDYIKEDEDLSFQPRILETHASAYLDGYWQNEIYFADVANIIRDEFQLNHFESASDDNMPGKRGGVVSLHIRRGDYAHNLKANAVHGVLGLEYYRNAVAYLANRIGNHFHIMVFSDDIEWARQNLDFEQSMSFISGSTVMPHEDLRKMASCDHHIIANSSFSWWGAWLNPSATKIVVAPKRWFVVPQLNDRNICPPSWERI